MTLTVCAAVAVLCMACQSGDLKMVLATFEALREQSRPDINTFNILLHAFELQGKGSQLHCITDMQCRAVC
jgi:hypothetical protein